MTDYVEILTFFVSALRESFLPGGVYLNRQVHHGITTNRFGSCGRLGASVSPLLYVHIIQHVHVHVTFVRLYIICTGDWTDLTI